MIFVSILAKTCAIALVPFRPVLAAVFWAAGVVFDLLVIRKAPAVGGAARLAGRVALLNVAALVIGLAAAAACDYAAMRWKLGIPLVSQLLAGLLNLVGVPAAAHQGGLSLTTMAGPLEMAASIDHLGLRVPASFLALAAVWLLWAGNSLRLIIRNLGIILGLLLVVTIVRTTGVVLLFLGLSDFVGYETDELPFRPFAEASVLIWSYLPVLLAAGVLIGRFLIRPVAADPEDETDTEVKKPAGLPLLIRCGGPPLLLLLFAVMLWEPKGTKKDGKVVINTYHAQWSQTGRPYDKEWYGADSGYNYACMKRLFGVFYPVVEATERLKASDLEDASVLVIFDPDRRFSKAELRVVHEFVRGGGGLLLIGDHTNVFGSTSHLNEVCEPLGFQYRDDVLFDLDEDFHQVIDRPPWPGRFWHGMEMFKLRGPCSIRPTSLTTRPIYQVGHSKSVRAIYSVNNFYPPPHDDPKMKIGTFCVAAASRYGRGRVVAWGDSTVFSNFEIFYPGKYEFLLNSMDWLHHKDGMLGGILRRVLPVALLAALAIFLVRRPNPRVWLGTAVLVVSAWFVARSASLWWERRGTEFPEPVQAADWLVFAADLGDQGHHLRDFIPGEPYDKRYDLRYEVFIQWVLRTGAYSGFRLFEPHHRDGLYEFLRDHDKVDTGLALIVRQPEDLEQLTRLGDGPAKGRDPLLLMFASTIAAEQVTSELQQAGIVKNAEALEQIAAAWPSGDALVEADGRRLLVIAGAERFSDQQMGISEKVNPNDQQRARFNEAFGLIDRFFGREPAAAPPTPTPTPTPIPIPPTPPSVEGNN